ncbi:MAG TPA: glycosyl transferase [Bacteroidetes bacterium]|jgi:glycosyltransferase involved in cell wall biosynthesis|nr:glycosyl transferase [Bacteroidota bacterium]
MKDRMQRMTPRISIGIPVYNGAKYLPEALESVLAQTYQDFEIVICDNGSTDQTKEIGERYAQKDPRIRFYRNETNVGPLRNFNRVFELSSDSTYFKFAPHDDTYAPEYLERCIAVLDEHPDVILCNSRIRIVDPRGNTIKENDLSVNGDLPHPSERFLAILNNAKCFELFAVIRRKALLQMPPPLLHYYAHADGILITRLGLLGRFHTIDEPLYFNRDYKERSGNTYKTYQEYTYFLDPLQRGHIVFPRWRMGREFVRSIGLVPLPFKERLRCYGHMCRWVKWYWTSLAWNLVVAARTAAQLLATAAARVIKH